MALHRFKRATISWSLGRVGSALEDYDAVIRMNPDFDQAYSSRGTIHLKQGRFQAAENDYRHVLKKNPNDVNAQAKVTREKEEEEKKKGSDLSVFVRF